MRHILSKALSFVLFATLCLTFVGCGCEGELSVSDAGLLADSAVQPDSGPIISDGGLIPDTGVDGGGCSALYTGRLIRGTAESTVYYVTSTGLRSEFPNPPTYASWFSDFARVETLADEALNAFPLGPRVRIRPGTQLVKITTETPVYAVTPCGVLRELASEAVAAQLYGIDWARRVVDVPSDLFVTYSRGAPVSSPVHPDGQLISFAGRTYLMEGGRRRLVSERAAADSNFRLEFVVSTTIVYPDGPLYDCAESLYQQVVCVTCDC